MRNPTVQQIIDALGGPTEFGKICQLKHPGARGWDMREHNSIPVKYWPLIIAAAKDRKLTWITAESLMAANAHKAA